jgi:hypothetical protein
LACASASATGMRTATAGWTPAAQGDGCHTGTAWPLCDQFSEGNKAGAAAVTTTVQQETIKAQENARREKEQIDEKVRSTPYDDRVDGLR